MWDNLSDSDFLPTTASNESARGSLTTNCAKFCALCTCAGRADTADDYGAISSDGKSGAGGKLVLQKLKRPAGAGLKLVQEAPGQAVGYASALHLIEETAICMLAPKVQMEMYLALALSAEKTQETETETAKGSTLDERYENDQDQVQCRLPLHLLLILVQEMGFINIRMGMLVAVIKKVRVRVKAAAEKTALSAELPLASPSSLLQLQNQSLEASPEVEADVAAGAAEFFLTLVEFQSLYEHMAMLLRIERGHGRENPMARKIKQPDRFVAGPM